MYWFQQPQYTASAPLLLVRPQLVRWRRRTPVSKVTVADTQLPHGCSLPRTDDGHRKERWEVCEHYDIIRSHRIPEVGYTYEGSRSASQKRL